MTNEKIIDELLHEAEELNIRREVMEFCKNLMEMNPRMERVDALILAMQHFKSVL